MNSQRVNRYSIFNARALFDHGDYHESLSNYLSVMHSISPDIRLQYINEFVEALKRYFDCEMDDGRVNAIVKEASIIPDLEFHVCRARSEWLFGRGKIFYYFFLIYI